VRKVEGEGSWVHDSIVVLACGWKVWLCGITCRIESETSKGRPDWRSDVYDDNDLDRGRSWHLIQ
jgi:hypothetical protein